MRTTRRRISKVRSRWTAWIALFALFGSLGGYWIVPQITAWVSMTAEQAVGSASRMGSIMDSIQVVWSGKRPCGICKSIKKSKADAGAAERTALLAHAQKLPAVIAIADAPERRPALSTSFAPDRDDEGATHSNPPPLPPPRA